MKDLLEGVKMEEFEAGDAPTSALGRSHKEAWDKIAGGRRADLLKERKIFDGEKLQESELFGGPAKGGLL